MADTLYIKDGQGTLQEFASTTFEGNVVPYHAISEITGTTITGILNKINDIYETISTLEPTVTPVRATNSVIARFSYTFYNTSKQILSDSNRKNLIILNNTDGKILLAIDSTASNNNFTYILEQGESYEASPTDVCLTHALILSGSATSGNVFITATT